MPDALAGKPSIKNKVLTVSKPYQHGIFEIALLVAVIGLFSWYVLKPKMNAVKASRERSASVEEENKTLESKRATMTQLVDQMHSRKADITKLDEALPLQPKISTLYMLVERYAQLSGMTVGAIGVNTNSDTVIAGNRQLLENPYGMQRHVEQVTANVTLSGSFEQFEAFLKKIENHPRIIDISSLDITATQDNQVDFKFALTTYYYAP